MAWLAHVVFILPVVALGSVNVPTLEVAPGVKMPVVSIGNGGQENASAYNITSAWLALGGRGIDNALMYRDQDTVAKAIKDSGVDRKSLFITTKIAGCDNARANVEEDLRQLGLDYVDLLLLHFPSGNCTAAWSTLEDFHSRGVLRSIGVSNFKVQDLEALRRTARIPPAVNQIHHNLLQHDDATVAYCVAHNITVEAFSPLGRNGTSGDLTGNEVVKEVAAEHGVTTYQVALKWIIQHGHMLVFQSTSSKHQEVDADIFGFTLTERDMARLDALHGSPVVV